VNRRNVMVILCDQLRPDFLPVYGCRAVPCPNIESLAAAGTVFDRAISCCPVCAPARASMMTGHYPSRHGVWTNDLPFRDGLEYLAHRMNALGYRTACFGKMHHFPADDLKGFQFGRLMEEGRLGEGEPYLQWLYGLRPDLVGDGRRWHHCSNRQFQLDDELHYEHWIASEAIEHLRRGAAEASAPLFTWVSFQGPHTPYNPPSKARGSVDPAGLPAPLEREGPVCPVHHYRGAWNPAPGDPEEVMRQRVAYAESIVHIDGQIGRILGALKETGMLETTTVIFSADHGDLIGDFGQLEKGPFSFSGQLNVPLILSNHPSVPCGKRSEVLTGNIDIPGTVLDAAGSEEGLGLSRSLLEQLPESSSLRREANFAECAGNMKLVETERYRFAVYPFTGFRELYDRREDPRDLNNLSGRPEYREVEMEMMTLVLEHAVICDGIEIGGFDLSPEIQGKLRELHPRFDRPGEFQAAFPLMKRAKEALRRAGIDPNYTNWFKNHRILAHYGLDFEER